MISTNSGEVREGSLAKWGYVSAIAGIALVGSGSGEADWEVIRSATCDGVSTQCALATMRSPTVSRAFGEGVMISWMVAPARSVNPMRAGRAPS